MLLAAEPCQHVFSQLYYVCSTRDLNVTLWSWISKKRRKGGRKGGGKKGKKEEEYLKVLVRKLASISNILFSMPVHRENNLFHA